MDRCFGWLFYQGQVQVQGFWSDCFIVCQVVVGLFRGFWFGRFYFVVVCVGNQSSVQNVIRFFVYIFRGFFYVVGGCRFLYQVFVLGFVFVVFTFSFTCKLFFFGLVKVDLFVSVFIFFVFVRVCFFGLYFRRSFRFVYCLRVEQLVCFRQFQFVCCFYFFAVAGFFVRLFYQMFSFCRV